MNASSNPIMVPCPCCEGEKRLWVEEDADGVVIRSVYDCTHCQGTGKIAAEVEPEKKLGRA